MAHGLVWAIRRPASYGGGAGRPLPPAWGWDAGVEQVVRNFFAWETGLVEQAKRCGAQSAIVRGQT